MTLRDRMKRGDPIWRRIVRRAFGFENKGFVVVQAIDGGGAGNHTVNRIRLYDHLVAVIAMRGTADGAGDLTDEFSLTANATINNTGGTNTTNMTLLVIWEAFDEE